eukprot:SAG31_NODE_42970_length_269_cov_0.611765_1_plen_53_part_01
MVRGTHFPELQPSRAAVVHDYLQVPLPSASRSVRPPESCMALTLRGEVALSGT